MAESCRERGEHCLGRLGKLDLEKKDKDGEGERGAERIREGASHGLRQRRETRKKKFGKDEKEGTRLGN